MPKSSFMIYANSGSILVPEDNEKQNPDESYKNKYKKHVACSYGYKLVCIYDKYSKPFTSYLGKNAVYNFISSMLEESKYCSDVRKKHFHKELAMTKKDKENFESSPKCWMCDNDYVGGNVKVWDHCNITGKYRNSARRYCNMKVKLNHKIPIVFHSLKNYDSYLIMQELGKFNFKINVIPNALKRYMSFNINKKLIFIDSFQFLRSSFDNLIKNFGKHDEPRIWW